MTAQTDEFVERGHPWSEIVNESVIEAADWLLPYTHARGVVYMVDNCSRTARLGARRWGPAFRPPTSRSPTSRSPTLPPNTPPTMPWLAAFIAHPVHEALAAAAKLRPSVDISVE